MNAKNRFGILVGGGPAPGINSVIGAATIRSALDGADVVGIFDGFRWLMQGNDPGREPNPLLGRVLPADIASQPDDRSRLTGSRRSDTD